MSIQDKILPQFIEKPMLLELRVNVQPTPNCLQPGWTM